MIKHVVVPATFRILFHDMLGLQTIQMVYYCVPTYYRLHTFSYNLGESAPGMALEEIRFWESPIWVNVAYVKFQLFRNHVIKHDIVIFMSISISTSLSSSICMPCKQRPTIPIWKTQHRLFKILLTHNAQKCIT